MSDGVAACPKCGRAREGGGWACGRCGLAVSRWASFRAPTEDPDLVTAWHGCEAAWDDPAAHLRALDVASRVGQLPLLARRYRAVLDRRPGDPVAAARLARIASVVEVSARTQATALRPATAERALWAVVYGSAGLLLLTTLWVLLKVMTHR